MFEAVQEKFGSFQSLLFHLFRKEGPYALPVHLLDGPRNGGTVHMELLRNRRHFAGGVLIDEFSHFFRIDFRWSPTATRISHAKGLFDLLLDTVHHGPAASDNLRNLCHIVAGANQNGNLTTSFLHCFRIQTSAFYFSILQL